MAPCVASLRGTTRREREGEGERWGGGGGIQYQAAGADAACDALRWRARGWQGRREKGWREEDAIAAPAFARSVNFP